MKKIINTLFCFVVLLLIAIHSYGQSLPTNINVDQISDAQLMQYLGLANSSGLSSAELETKAREKGLSEEQIQKLKQRIIVANAGGTNAAGKNNIADSNDLRTKVVSRNAKPATIYTANALAVFGSELFSTDNLTFEPNLQIPTPKNYVIGTGDKINIDLFGYSDAAFKLQVNPEGIIRIPNLGPIKINGLNFDDATQKIKSKLVAIYPQIASGKTSVQITLGQIRTIRVTMIGEIAKPGTYSLPSLASLVNALYVAGGPNAIGSYRDIELIRNGKVMANFDLYDFLLKGDLSKSLRLEDDDIIKVNPYLNRVIFTGAIKRPAIYEVRNTDNMKDLLSVSGGFSDRAFKDFIRVVRVTHSQKEAITVPAAAFGSFTFRSGDSCYVDAIFNRYTNRIIIDGAVYHPGVYSLSNFSSLKNLLQTANLREDAYLQRGIISRRNDQYVPIIQDFNVADIVNGKSDIILQREDSIKIFSVFDIKPKDSISIIGEVNKPGDYTYTDSLQLQDIILMAGGFKEGASNTRIDIARRIKDSTSELEKQQYAIITTIELHKNLSENIRAAHFTLEPFDIITIRKNPSYQEQITVTVEGEVMYPGQYTLEHKKETLSALIARAGGLKSTAYPKGAVLLRNDLLNDGSRKVNNISKLNLLAISDSSSQLNKDSLLNSLNANAGGVGIRLQEALAQPGSAYDIYLQNGDELSVPTTLQTIKTTGSVYIPKQVVYIKDKSFKYYIGESGGFSPRALKSRSFVVYANGQIKRTHHFLMIRSYPSIEPGAEIFVPVKKVRVTSTLAEVGAIGTVLSGLATTYLILRSLGL